MAQPTIVLIHGAFGDASSWRPVFNRLVDDGHTVLAPPNPCAGFPTTPPTRCRSSTSSTARSCWSATRTAER